MIGIHKKTVSKSLKYNIFHRFNQQKDEIIIPQCFFEDRKERMIRLLFAPANEKFAKSFINKLEIFTNYRVKFNTVWNTRNVRFNIV